MCERGGAGWRLSWGWGSLSGRYSIGSRRTQFNVLGLRLGRGGFDV